MSDENTTDETTEMKPSDGGPRGPKRLTRSGRDRVLAGVAGGLGRYFNVDPIFFRIGFGVSVFFGGLGAIAYLALALFVPGADDEGVRPPRPARILAWFGIAILALIASAMLGLFSGWAAATGHGVAVAAVVIGIGVVLALAAFRSRGARWLILPALVLALPLAAVTAAGISFGDGVGERSYRPASVSEIPAKGYELGIGHMAVDLRGLAWKRGQTVELKSDLGLGETEIAVPSRVCVVADAHAKAGAINIAGSESDGTDVTVERADAAGTPQLRLDSHVDLGAIRVVNSDAATIDDHGDHHDDAYGNDATAQAANAKACGARK